MTTTKEYLIYGVSLFLFFFGGAFWSFLEKLQKKHRDKKKSKKFNKSLRALENNRDQSLHAKILQDPKYDIKARIISAGKISNADILSDILENLLGYAEAKKRDNCAPSPPFNNPNLFITSSWQNKDEKACELTKLNLFNVNQGEYKRELLEKKKQAVILCQAIIANSNYKNQRLINFIAESDMYSNDVRITAIKRVRDEKLLAKIAADSKNGSEQKKAAISIITNQELLYESVIKDMLKDYRSYSNSNSEIMRAAVSKISNLKLLREIAKVYQDKHIIESIMDEAELIDIACLTNEFYVIKEVVQKVKNKEAAIEQVMRKHKNSNVRKEVLDIIESQETLSIVAKNDDDFFIRSKALSKLNDQKTITEIAKNDECDLVRKEAMAKTLDVSVLEELSKLDKSFINRQQAAKKIRNDDKVWCIHCKKYCLFETSETSWIHGDNAGATNRRYYKCQNCTNVAHSEEWDTYWG